MQINATGTSQGYTAYSGITFGSNQFSQIRVNAIDSSANSAVEISTNNVLNTSTKTQYVYYASASAATGSGIIKIVNGSSTVLASQASAPGCAAGDILRLENNSGVLTAYRNGAVATGFTNPVTDIAITGGAPGFRIVQSNTASV